VGWSLVTQPSGTVYVSAGWNRAERCVPAGHRPKHGGGTILGATLAAATATVVGVGRAEELEAGGPVVRTAPPVHAAAIRARATAKTANPRLAEGV
jgi:hypothetical protein